MKLVNCRLFSDGKCLHQAAPRQWLGTAKCILVDPPKDIRLIQDCAIKRPYDRPPAATIPTGRPCE
jgi:hypothetical protein